MDRIDDLRYSLVPVAIVLGGIVGLIMLQPDLGTALTIIVIVAAMVFAAGINYRYIIGLLLVSLPAAYIVLMSADYRRRRMLVLPRPVGGSAGRRLPGDPVADRGRHGRPVRTRPDGGRAEAVLPARTRRPISSTP